MNAKLSILFYAKRAKKCTAISRQLVLEELEFLE
jgi:hypothetical protein